MQIYFHSRLCSYLSRVPILVEGTVLSMRLRICSVLAVIAGHTVFPRNSKNVQVSFSPFVFKITNLFLEKMGITVVPRRSTFFSNLF